MIPAWQLPRHGLIWLLVAFVATVAGHWPQLPIWIVLAAAAVVVWQVQVWRGLWRYPGLWVKVALLGLCVAGMLLHFRRLTGLEPMTTLLVAGLALKLVEMHTRRDAVVVVFIMLLVTVIQALYFQTIVATLYLLLCLGLSLTALVAMHQSPAPASVSRPLLLPFRRSLGYLALALPVMLLLFLVMPRIGSLWAVPSQQHKAKTGISDFMSPGDISDLSRSAEVAFRVSFDGAMPPPQLRYWRGLVFSEFDGRTWRQSDPRFSLDGDWVRWPSRDEQPWFRDLVRIGEPVRYQVVMEPTYQPWLFALDVPGEVTDLPINREFRLFRTRPVDSKFAYRAASWTDYGLDLQLTERDRRLNTYLPRGSNPESQQRAQQWRAEEGSDIGYINRLLRLFNREFVYTLQPRQLGANSIDDFLWQTKQGFCEHFSSSFVVMLRAAGIPARVVTGYQGGEVNPNGNFLVVRQYDAHAWAEVWLPERGWVRYDPTAAVAPERIERGMAELFGADPLFANDNPLSLERFRAVAMFNLLRLKLDEMEYYWSTWVLGYDQIQQSVLERLIGSVDVKKLAMVMVGAGGAIMLFISWMSLLRGRRRALEPHYALYQRFCAKLEKVGIPRHRGEGIADYSRRIARQRPDLAATVTPLAKQFQALLYATQGEARDAMQRQLTQELKRFRPGHS